MKKIRDQTGTPYEEYIDRIGQLVNVRVRKFENSYVVVDLGGNVLATLPNSAKLRSDHFTEGELIRAVIMDVSHKTGLQIRVSRNAPEFFGLLLEMEVPEINDGKVVIKSTARKPGEHSKVAVMSTERDVDPVAACHSRVNAITRELRGEKIDFIEWSNELTVFAARALTPAKVMEVKLIDAEVPLLEAVVSEDQHSLARGKRDENVQLAEKLVRGRINIKLANET